MNTKLKTLSALLLVAVIAVFQSGLTLFSFTCLTAQIHEIGLTEPVSCCKVQLNGEAGVACAVHQGATDGRDQLTNKCCDIQVHTFQVEQSFAPQIQTFQAPVLAVMPALWAYDILPTIQAATTRYAGLRGPPWPASPYPSLFEAYQVWRI